MIRRKSKMVEHICELSKTSDSNLQRLPPNAIFYLRWMRNLKKLFLVSVSHPFTRHYLRSRAAIAFEKRRHGRSLHWWVIHPCSNLRFIWDILMAITYIYIFVLIPHIVSFHRIGKSANQEMWKLIHPAFFICFIDIILNFITGYSLHEGYEIILDPILIARHYSKGYFLIDLISSIPHTLCIDDFLIPQPGPDSNPVMLILEFLPFLKALRLPTYRHYILQIAKCLNFSHTQQTIVWFSMLSCLFIHWSACISYVFPYLVNHIKKKKMLDYPSYLMKINLNAEPNWKIYLIYLHIGLSNFVGSSFMEIKKFNRYDKAIRCLLMIIGCGYMIYLLALILQIAESSAAPDLKYQEMMYEVLEYAEEKKLPKKLKDRLIAYYKYRYQGNYFKENVISHTLSDTLKQEAMIYSNRGLLETATIFHNLPRSVLGSLMAALIPIVHLENDVIFKAGNDADCMYFISSGTVALITLSGKEICHVADGGYFGEVALVYPERQRLYSVVALEICELLRFNRRDFIRLVSSDSELYTKLQYMATDRINMVKEINKMNTREEF